jgi:hypothetical protein
MTVTGLVLLPVFLIAILLPWRRVLVVLVLASLFSDAAVINVGSVGLQPGFCFMVLIILRTSAEMLAAGQGLDRYLLRKLTPLGLLFAVASFVLLLSVIFFEGQVRVLPGRMAMNLDLAEPYSFRFENINQMTLLLIDIVTLYCVAHQARAMRLGEFSRAADFSVVVAGFFSAGVAFWELAHFYSGVPFPTEFFHSNAGYISGAGQIMGTIPRISGPFGEPSTLGSVFGGFLQFAWRRHHLLPTVCSRALLVACVATVAVSTSTTGYFGLALFLLVVTRDMMFRNGSLVAGLARWRMREVSVVLTLLVVAVGGAYFVLADRQTIRDVLDVQILDKDESSSFDERAAVDVMALDIFAETDGLGIGLGSHRPNSLVMTLLSNLGVFGTAAFAYFLFHLFRLQRGAGRGEDFRVLQQLKWLVAGTVMMQAFSGYALTGSMLWIAFGLTLGTAVESRKFAHPRVIMGAALGPNGRARGNDMPAAR